MRNKIYKFVGTYRVKAEIDQRTNDYYRDNDGNIVDDYLDMYIDCMFGTRVYFYGKEKRRNILEAYIPSIGRGNNIIKNLQDVGIFDISKNDKEVSFKFYEDDIEMVMKYLKPKTAGCNIKPFSTSNLPKNKSIKIPLDKIALYKEITKDIIEVDKLCIHRITVRFLHEIVEKSLSKRGKPYDSTKEKKRLGLAKKTKEYIYHIGMWDEYMKYLGNSIKDIKENL